MQPFPHHYRAEARGATEGQIRLTSDALPAIESAPPVEFGGPGDRWSPETLFVAAVADCFVLTFCALAAASGLAYEEVHCTVEGALDRAEGKMRFVSMTVRATLRVSAGVDRERALRLLEKAERGCLVTSSLLLTPQFDGHVEHG